MAMEPKLLIIPKGGVSMEKSLRVALSVCGAPKQGAEGHFSPEGQGAQSGHIRGYARLESSAQPHLEVQKGPKHKKMLKMKDDPDELLKNKWTKIVTVGEPDELLKTNDLLEKSH
jgi:hypothetical protein